MNIKFWRRREVRHVVTIWSNGSDVLMTVVGQYPTTVRLVDGSRHTIMKTAVVTTTTLGPDVATDNLTRTTPYRSALVRRANRLLSDGGLRAARWDWRWDDCHGIRGQATLAKT